MATYLEIKMAETKTKEPVEAAEKPVEAAEKPEGFTKMRNISKQTLQLASGALPPEKTTAYNAAEFSTLHMFLEGVE